MAGSNNFCKKCGTKVTSGEKFCSNCGFQLAGAMLLSIFNGGISRLGKGVGALFSKTEGKMGIIPMIIGFFSGFFGGLNLKFRFTKA